MDEVFKALADPTRRELLDRLRERDGQSLSALEEGLPMSRFGVMKHLKVLEGAGLVTTQKRGREKLHFLNPVPIRLIHDRWVSKYAEPWASALSELKTEIGGRAMSEEQAYTVVGGRGAMTVFEIYIKTTPERLWEAITSEQMRKRYSFGVGTASEWTPGSEYRSEVPGVIEIAAGKNLE